MKKTLIQNARVWSSQGFEERDVLVDGLTIAQVEPKINPSLAEDVIDASGLELLPGVMDPQVHFRDPGFPQKEDLYSGSKAAAAGGVTSFLEMPNTKPPTISIEAMATKKQVASEKCLVNYNFFIGATSENLDVLNSVENVCGIKIFMGSSTGNLLVDDPEALENIFAHGTRLIAVHAEDEQMLIEAKEKYKDSTNFADHANARPAEAALKASQLALSLSKKYQRRLHILHMTTKQEVEMLRADKPAWVSCEVCPQHLLLSSPEAYDRLGSFAQMNPPIRTKDHGQALWQGLKDGVIDCMATDHAPHTFEEKQQPFGSAPSGMPGVEILLPLMLNQVHEGNCRLEDVILWQCERPVSLYNVQNKGRIAPGYDADIILVDLQKRKKVENGKLHSKVNWSSFDGFELQGWPILTMVGGHVVFREGDFFEDVKGRELIIGS